MKRVLLTHSYFLRFDPKQWKMQQAYPPLATLYAASLLRENNFDVQVFDPMFEFSAEAISPVIESFKPDYLVIYDDGFNYLTKMCLTNMREAAFRMLKIASDKNIITAISSSDSTDHSLDYLQHGANYIIRGEGEITLLELLTGLAKGNSQLDQINGLAFLKEDKMVTTPKRDVLRDLDVLPHPAWDLIDVSGYKNRWRKSGTHFSLNISTTRGCPFHCNWCAKPIYGNRYNVHSPKYVTDEIKFLKEKFGANYFWMTDDIFGLKPGWVKEFADLIEKEIPGIRFKIQSRVDLLTTENTVEHLARAGCDAVWMGAESGSQKILDAMDKGTTVDQIREATALLKKNKIHPAFFLQFGYPGETMKDIRMTLKMVEELQPDDIGISVSYPLPGTVFYERIKREMGQKKNWTDSDDLSVMFKSPFPAEFYKNLQRYVHRSFRLRQGLELIKGKSAGMSSGKIKRAMALPLHFLGKKYHLRKMKSISEEASVL
ncbi:MAG: radical SAM protein [Bacteroidia bacterium]